MATSTANILTEGQLVQLEAITDDFQLGQRRRYSRAPIAVDVRLRPLASGGAEWRTVTRDISAGSVRARAEVVRRTAADVSLRFTDIDDTAAALLQQLSVAYHRLAAERR